MLHGLLAVAQVIGPVPLGVVREGVSKKKAHRIAMGFSQTGRHAAEYAAKQADARPDLLFLT